MAAKFVLPETFSKPNLKPNSVKEYTRLLNHLSNQGITSLDDIVAPSGAGVPSGLARTANTIYDLSPGTESSARAIRRAYISAVNWVLPVAYRKKKKSPLYTLFQRSLPLTDVRNDEPWLPYNEYRKRHPELFQA